MAARGEVVPEGLLDHGAHPAVLDSSEAPLAERLDDRLVGVGRSREIEDAVPRPAASFLDVLESRLELPKDLAVLEGARDVPHDGRQVARPALGRGRELLRTVLEPLAEVGVGILRPADPDDRELRRDRPVAVEVRDRRGEQPVRQVSGRPEDDERAGRTDLFFGPPHGDENRVGGSGFVQATLIDFSFAAMVWRRLS